MDSILHYVMVGLTALSGAFVGSFLAGYLSKKGENLARKEDIDDLIKEVHAVTTTTKQIEARISGEVWDRQKRWELRRDVAFEAAKASGAVRDALTTMQAVYMTEKQSAAQGKPGRPGKQAEVYAAFNNAAEKLELDILLVGIACGKETLAAVNDFALFTRDMAAEIAEGKPEKLRERQEEFVTKHIGIGRAIRKEMALDEGG